MEEPTTTDGVPHMLRELLKPSTDAVALVHPEMPDMGALLGTLALWHNFFLYDMRFLSRKSLSQIRNFRRQSNFFCPTIQLCFFKISPLISHDLSLTNPHPFCPCPRICEKILFFYLQKQPTPFLCMVTNGPKCLLSVPHRGWYCYHFKNWSVGQNGFLKAVHRNNPTLDFPLILFHTCSD